MGDQVSSALPTPIGRPEKTSTTPEATWPLRIVKLGSEGIAIKPDTGDLRTDMKTLAICGVDESLARMFAAAPRMLIALKAFSLFSALIGKDGRPDWFKDDGAWTEFVIADGYRMIAIAKAEEK